MSIIACSVDGCERSHHCKGFCKMHYTRQQRHGDPLVRKYKTGTAPSENEPCIVSGCENPYFARKMCPMHYRRFRLHGDPELGGSSWPTSCSVDECSKDHYGLGFCVAHYTRQARHGDASFRGQGEVRDGKKVCSQCGRDLPIGMYRQGRMSACRTCAKKYVHARRALLASAKSDDYRPDQIFNRDNWVCQICKDPVSEILKWPHRFSASVDHITPLSKGGDDTFLNVQLAHLTCNISKGVKLPT